MSVVKINGVSISGNNVCITNGKVIVDGVSYTGDDKKINIVVEGNIERINCDCCEKIQVNGNVGGDIKTMSGDVTIEGEVGGGVSTQSGNIECGDIQGNTSTMSGDVKCGNINGDVSTVSGDIKNRK